MQKDVQRIMKYASAAAGRTTDLGPLWVLSQTRGSVKISQAERACRQCLRVGPCA